LEPLDIFRALRVLLSRHKIDVVVSVFEGASVPLLLSRNLFGFKPPVVLWDIGLTESWPLRERFLDLSVPRVDGIMVLGSNQSAYIEKRWHARRKTRVIFHRVDVDFFHPTEEEPEDYIFSVGDDEGRDYDTLLRACENSDFTLKLKSRRNISASLSGAVRIESIRGRISYLELRSLYARSQFVVVPLKQTLNASGVSTILEAGAMGKAAIVSENQGIVDFIVPGETCLTVPCEDALAMRQAMDRLSKDPALRERLGRNARDFVTTRFSDKVFAANFSQTLLEFSGKSEK
jgi:glycosyltransferase involved in cell wall biosynthesis